MHISSKNLAISANSNYSGMPSHYYFDPDIFKQELNTVWRSTWQMVGREEELSQVGDYLTCTLGEESILIVRTADEELQAMHNVCPHRGATLLEGQGNCSLIRCPYHAWRFDLNGNLRGISHPEQFPNLDKSTVTLLKARVDTWNGFIFVNPDPTGESLEQYLNSFTRYLQQYEYSWKELREVDYWYYDQPMNWKFFIENYVESYHLPILHATSIHNFDDYTIRSAVSGRHLEITVSCRDTKYNENRQMFLGATGDVSYQGFIFPNIMVNTAKDNVAIFKLCPRTPESTRFEVRIFQTPAQMALFPYNKQEFRTAFEPALWEDFSAIRRLQAGVHSRAYRVNHLAQTREFGIVHFHQVFSEYLLPIRNTVSQL